LFYARAANAHSADLLPLNRVAVTLSYQTNGNRLVVFDIAQSDVELLSVELRGGHGVVWDKERQVLWALADYEVREYQLQNWNSAPSLHLRTRLPLPDASGHDMSPIPNSAEMLITTGTRCWLFHRETHTFREHPLLGSTPNVKGASVHPSTGEVIYVQAETEWWSERLRFLPSGRTLHIPGTRLYKARWIPPPRLSILRTITNTVVVSWPSSPVGSNGLDIQESPTLEGASWQPPGEQLHHGSTNKFIIVAPTTDGRFYRLNEPLL
jgi:hypothetical protein